MSNSIVWAWLAIVFWLATLFHVIRTQDYALSSKSQLAWLFLVFFFPFFGALAYLGFELPRRRSRRNPPGPPTGVA